MRIKKRRQALKKKPLVITALMLILLVLLGVALAYHYQIGPFHKEGPTTQEILEKQNKSDSTNPRTKAQSTLGSKDVDKTKSTDEVPVSNTTKVEIIKLAQENHAVVYSATVTNPGDSGTCSAIFTNDIARPVTSTTAADGNTCGPVTIPEAEFSALGTWTLTLRYYTNNTQAETTKTLEVR